MSERADPATEDVNLLAGIEEEDQGSPLIPT